MKMFILIIFMISLVPITSFSQGYGPGFGNQPGGRGQGMMAGRSGQRGMGRGAGNCLMIHEKLNLNEGQQKKMANLKKDQMQSRHNIRIQMKDLRFKLKMVLFEKKINDKDATNLINKIVALEKKQMIAKVKHIKDLKEILTDEQIQLLDLDSMFKGRGGHRGRGGRGK